MIDSVTGVQDVVHSGRGLYYGITFSEKYIYVAARNSVNCFDYLGHQVEERGEIIIFNSRLKEIGNLHAPFPLRDMHQILFFDEKLWVTCSLDNMVAVYDFHEWKKWYPIADCKDEGKDVYHYNSLFFHGQRLYVLAHNFGPSFILEFSYPDLVLQKRYTLGNQAHNIWLSNSHLFTCDSFNGTVVNEQGVLADLGGFTRGAVGLAGKLFIGSSDIAERADRSKVSSEIFELDDKWNILSKISIQGHGQLLDLRCPGAFDSCSPSMTGPQLFLRF